MNQARKRAVPPPQTGRPRPAKPAKTTVAALRALLRATADPRRAEGLRRFFKTGPGQYGEGDRFLGLRVPDIRRVARQGAGLPLSGVVELLHSEYHEERLLALLLLVRRFERGSLDQRAEVFQTFMTHRALVNNWDFVDLSAPGILGAWLLIHPRDLLHDLARSANLWERRMAIVATFTLIRQGQFADTVQVAEMLLADRHDLIHKACGWMLREVGKRDLAVLRAFLTRHAARMPRTMLRYALEKLPLSERRAWMSA